MNVSKRILFHKIAGDSYLLLNTLTGAIDIVDSDVYGYLAAFGSNDAPSIDAAIRTQLERRGYLVPDDNAEQALLQRISALFKTRTRRQVYVICPTYSCNLRCTYCFEGDVPQTHHLFMDVQDVAYALTAIDTLRESDSEHDDFIQLFGGEPLLPKTRIAVQAVFEGAKERSLPVGISTNGTHVPQFMDILTAYSDTLRTVQITLDGPELFHDSRRKTAHDEGTFDAVCRAIELLLGADIDTMVRVNVDMHNVDSLHELYDSFNERGWRSNKHFSCNLSPVSDHSCASTYPYLLPEDELVERIFAMLKSNPELQQTYELNMFRSLRHIRKVLGDGKPALPLLYYCEANNLENLVFGPDGNIYACTECVGREEFAIGRFKPRLEIDEAAAALWNNRNVLTIDDCKTCNIALLCGGGCAYSAILVNGDINKPVCNRTRETIDAYLHYIHDELVQLAT